MLKIGDIVFKKTSIILDAYIDSNQLVFGLEILANSTSKKFASWSPKLICEDLIRVPKKTIHNIDDLSGRQIIKTNKFTKDGEPFALLHVFQHSPLYNNKISFTKNNLSELSIEWLAKADIKRDEEYGENIDIYINGKINFKGVWCGRKSQEECDYIVGNFLDIQKLSFTLTEDNVSLLVPQNNNIAK